MEIVGKESRFLERRTNKIPLIGDSMCLLGLLPLPHLSKFKFKPKGSGTIEMCFFVYPITPIVGQKRGVINYTFYKWHFLYSKTFGR